MSHIFLPVDTERAVELSVEQIKKDWILVINSPTRISLQNKETKAELLLSDPIKQRQVLLDDLGIKIESISVAKTENVSSAPVTSYYIGGDLSASNVTVGDNNNVTNICNGVSYMTIGSNMFVGPK